MFPYLVLRLLLALLLLALAAAAAAAAYCLDILRHVPGLCQCLAAWSCVLVRTALIIIVVLAALLER
jgi:hypothetical protein